MNFPKKSAVVTAIIWSLLLAGMVTLLVSHRSYVASYPLILPWIVLSLAVGIGLFFLNFAGIRFRGPVFALLGYGVFAALGAFVLQSVVNGSLAGALGESARTSWGALALGFGSGFCQTLGKGIAIGLIIRGFKARALKDVLEIGLAVGLGFGLAEVVLLAEQAIAHPSPITNLLGVVERGSAQCFHIYSGALVALGIGYRKWWMIAFVLVAHTVIDGLAGGLVPGGSILWLEIAFALIALATWGCYLVAKRGLQLAETVLSGTE